MRQGISFLYSLVPNSLHFLLVNFTMYSLGCRVVKKVLQNVFREFHRLLGCTAAAVLPKRQAKSSFRKYFTKPFTQPATPDCTAHLTISPGSPSYLDIRSGRRTGTATNPGRTNTIPIMMISTNVRMNLSQGQPVSSRVKMGNVRFHMFLQVHSHTLAIRQSF